MLVDLEGFGRRLELRQAAKFSLQSQAFDIKFFDHAEFQKDLEFMSTPMVVFLGLFDGVAETLLAIRSIWPYTSVIVAAEESRLTDVYPLLASGASDFVSLSATNAEIEEKCLIQVGVHQARMRDSSRTLGELTINFAQRTVTNGKQTAHLTPIEVNIVRVLIDSFGGVVPREKMKQICWGDAEISDNALNRKIYEVRRTLARLCEGINIRTIYGSGFELQVRD